MNTLAQRAGYVLRYERGSGDAFQAPALMLRTAPCFTVPTRWASIAIAEGDDAR